MKQTIEYIQMLATFVQKVGPSVLLDESMLRQILHGFDYMDETKINDLVRQIKYKVLQPSKLPNLDPESIQMIKTLKRDIGSIKTALATCQELTMQQQEAIREYLLDDDKHIERLILPHVEDSLYYDVRVFVDKGRYAIAKKSGRKTDIIHVTNFVLYPKSRILVDNRDIKMALYNFTAVSAIDGARQDIVLTVSDFNSAADFQKAMQRSARYLNPTVHDLQSHMRGMAYELTERAWKDASFVDQRGTTVLGYERFSDDGEKYVCTVNGDVYNAQGEVVRDVVFVDPMIRIPGGDFSISNIYGNMAYDKDRWKDTAKFILQNIMKINKKDVMANVAGWLFGNIQEYNIRNVVSEFPLLHIAGPKSSGKTLTVRALKPYFGYVRNDVEHFPTAPIFTQNLTISYTIPSIMDEYGGSDRNQGWTDFVYNEMHKILKQAYSKGTVEKAGKGDGGQGRFQYKIRNSSCSLGQTYIRDTSIADRTIQVSVDGSIKDTEEGKIAYQVSKHMMDHKDKNFITGLMIWCMNIPDEEIKEKVRYYVEHNERTVKSQELNYDNRQQQNTAAIQTGMYLMLRLARELGVDVGFDEQYILDMVIINANLNERLFSKTTDDSLIAFLKDVALHVRLFGNSSSVTSIYGLGDHMFSAQGKDSTVPGKYGRDKKIDEACVFDHTYVAMNMQHMIGIVNKDLQRRGKDAHDFGSIQPYIESAFNKSKAKQGAGLVLAPSNYEYQKVIDGTRYKGRYTLFNLKVLSEVDEVFATNQFWDCTTGETSESKMLQGRHTR